MERQELIKKIEQLPPDRLAEVERFVESIASGEPELERASIHEAIAEYAVRHAGTDVDLPLLEEYRASIKEIVEEVALARAIDEDRDTPRVTREEIFQILAETGR
jgi:hypothetical protein